MGVKFTNRYDDVNSSDAAIVCVPTPRKESGECDISIVEETIEWLETPLIIIKSTIEIGTTSRLIEMTGKPLVFSPEYAGESTYWSPYDFHTEVVETPFFIFGGERKNTSKCVDLYMKIGGPTKKYVQTDSATAEMAKYMENAFYATKITFSYEMAEICRSSGIDYNEARELWLLDPRINPMHTAVFEENDMPFSGKCLPKDTAALYHLGTKLGYKPELIYQVLKSNETIGHIRKNRRNN